MIRNPTFAAAAAPTLMSGAAMAQTATQADIASFIRDSSGQAIGSCRQSRTARRWCIWASSTPSATVW